MTLEDFKKATKIMFEAFTPIKPVDRLSAMYEFFKLEDKVVIERASRLCSGQMERFPSIPAFGSILADIKRREAAKGTVSNEIRCKDCDNIGLVTAIDEKDKTTYAYRCKCNKASQYPNIPAWFGTRHEGKRLWKSIVYSNEPKEEPPF